MKIRKLLKTFVATGILLIMCSVFFFGCDKNNQPNNNDNNNDIVDIGKENVEKYHAKLYIPKKNWFKKEFLENNLTGGMFVEGELDEYGIPIEGTWFVVPDTYPTTRYFIINDQEKLNDIFSSFPIELNFNQQIGFLFLQTTMSVISKEYTILSRIELVNDELSIGYSSTLDPSIPSASEPIQKYIFVVMDRIKVDKVNFYYHKNQ